MQKLRNYILEAGRQKTKSDIYNDLLKAWNTIDHRIRGGTYNLSKQADHNRRIFDTQKAFKKAGYNITDRQMLRFFDTDKHQTWIDALEDLTDSIAKRTKIATLVAKTPTAADIKKMKKLYDEVKLSELREMINQYPGWPWSKFIK